MTSPPDPAPESPVEARQDWDETPAEAALYDRLYWNREED
ncbi:hypothetical protein GCM10023220_67510 [Streptomyces ziwulingensis]|uniref:SAM-dependent methyltransferase n=1 Tax=Streptomyces ziwulingensis TaxID=1045501 RepID=A0ABP9D4I7_9ACTN